MTIISGGRSCCGDREARDTLLALAQDKKGPLSVDHVTVLLSWFETGLGGFIVGASFRVFSRDTFAATVWAFAGLCLIIFTFAGLSQYLRGCVRG